MLSQKPIKSMNLVWKRPEVSKAPIIWNTFTAKRKNSDKVEEFRIADLEPSRVEEGVAFMTKYYLGSEPLCVAYDISKHDQSIEDYQSIWRTVLTQNMGTVCFAKESDEIVAMNATYIKHKDDHFFPELIQCFKSTNMRGFIDAYMTFVGDFSVFNAHNVNEYYTDTGIAVSPKYLGLGICEQFLLNRSTICKDLGVKLTSSGFTSDYSNRIADKTGFNVDREMRYDNLRTAFPHLKLPQIDSEWIKIRCKRMWP